MERQNIGRPKYFSKFTSRRMLLFINNANICEINNFLFKGDTMDFQMRTAFGCSGHPLSDGS
ncbi:hypothetical protein [Desulfotignum balticum]|jgi:hypothetical protein|uniref:hypothetical protein n=1 Tax=Desulfotignum balticum TaxID=115781 RepID=UPI000462A979|nr:hypothetical protein [Desulfotignum balticum]